MTVKNYGQVEIDDGGTLEMFERLAKLGGDQSEALDAIGDAWLARVQLGFAGGADPWGVPWAPLKWRSGQPLRDKGHLMNSYSYQVSGGDTLDLGTNYGQLTGGGSIAAVHQFGTNKAGRGHKTRIPARPMLPISEYAALPKDWADEALEILRDAIDAAARPPGAA